MKRLFMLMLLTSFMACGNPETEEAAANDSADDSIDVRDDVDTTITVEEDEAAAEAEI